MKIFATLFASFLTVICLSAQQLPHFSTADEAHLLPNYQIPSVFLGITDPPTAPVRTMAEWEELQALVITWNGFNAILAEIVRASRLECKVIIVCRNETTVNSAKTYLTSKNVDFSSNVEFLIAENDSLWVRDYGPNTIYLNNVDSAAIVDWIYNRARYDDDLVPERVAKHLNLPVYSTTKAPYDLVNTGGNFMTDGLGQAFASTLVMTNNDRIQNGECGNLFDLFGTSNHTEASIDNIMQKFMGIHTYIKLEKLPFDCIHHIDMHMKLLDEETLLVGEYPTGRADGPQIEANLQYILANFKNAFGKPYKVIRIPMPPDHLGRYPDNQGLYRTYVNAVFVNKSVLVPFYEEKYDTTARRIWQEAMPGYNIVGINCNQIIPSLGAIHCITKEVGVNDPIQIVHEKLTDVDEDAVPSYPVEAIVRHRSGIEVVRLFYTTNPNSGNWQSIEMLATGNDRYLANIPAHPQGSTIYYFIEGKANSGRARNLPLPAPKGYFKFKILGTTGTSHVQPTIFLEKIYPNPASSMTVVPLQTSQKTTVSARVFDVFGKKHLEIFNGELPAGKHHLFVDASLLPAGTYFVEIISGTTKNVGKMIVR